MKHDDDFESPPGLLGMKQGAPHAGPLFSLAPPGAVTGSRPLLVIGGLLAELAAPEPGDTIH